MPRLALLQYVVLAVCTLVLSDVPLAAQQRASSSARRVPVTVVMLDSLPGEDASPFRILRRADTSPNDVILLSAGADSLALSEAIAELVQIRQLQGDSIRTGSGMMRTRRAGARARSARILPWASRVINDLRTAELQDISGVGAGRAVQIWLPPQAVERHRPAAPGTR
jgi:hypothetical protein